MKQNKTHEAKVKGKKKKAQREGIKEKKNGYLKRKIDIKRKEKKREEV